MSKNLTLDEVKKHKDEKSVWIIIHNDVYDVTKFLEEHPGGADSLLEVAGKDGTQAFEDVGHSDDARELLKKYKIGTLPPGERCKIITDCCKPRAARSSSSRNSSEKSWRTYDGSPASSRRMPCKSEYKPPASPRVDRRISTIVVPRERCGRSPPCPPPRSSKLKWAVVALAGALLIGIVLKKYLN
ncbi:cytochrome b5-like [Bombyx mandarina]|uniref:Cytochrome b5-like n=1 Tax=Bombyx mandarina TaxID=7092 RepID=A0A6J2K4F8_BOMMA|nr:cytochrome b5-like [Bombyx mandarina]